MQPWQVQCNEMYKEHKIAWMHTCWIDLSVDKFPSVESHIPTTGSGYKMLIAAISDSFIVAVMSESHRNRELHILISHFNSMVHYHPATQPWINSSKFCAT